MPDLAERIRNYVDVAQPSVTLEQVKATLNQQSHGSNGGSKVLYAHRRSVLVGGLVAGGIAASLAAFLSLSATDGGGGTSHKPGIDLATAPATVVLRTVADVATSQTALVPGPGQFLYVRKLGASEESQGFTSPATGLHSSWTYYGQYVTQTWTSPTGPNSSSVGEVGVPQFLTNADQVAWQANGSPPIMTGGSGGLITPYYDVTDLPTDPTKIAGYLRSQPGLPNPDLSSNPVWQFDEAAEYLGAGASSQQRAALYSFMATLPGVVNYGTVTTLGTGQTGTAIGIPGRNGERVEVVIDTPSSNILELRVVVADPSQYPTALAGMWKVVAGEAYQYFDFVSVGVVDSNSSIPSDAPPLPSPWPFGEARAPAPTVAYPS